MSRVMCLEFALPRGTTFVALVRGGRELQLGRPGSDVPLSIPIRSDDDVRRALAPELAERVLAVPGRRVAVEGEGR